VRDENDDCNRIVVSKISREKNKEKTDMHERVLLVLLTTNEVSSQNRNETSEG
jgi:hypothetical protein